MATWAELAGRAERWILPAECVACQRAIEGSADSLVCDVCRARWRPLDPPLCARCGESLPLGLACRTCADWPPEFAPVRSAVRLDPTVRHLVHRFKYQGLRRLAETFVMPMLPLLRDWPDADLVPVPLAARRRRQRGYNQAEVLAAALAGATGRPLRPGRLQRMRSTPTQTRLTPEERRANVAVAFAASASRRPVILVDDVFTTGATLCSAAAELLDRGAGMVAAITFARAPLPLSDAARDAARSRFTLNQDSS